MYSEKWEKIKGYETRYLISSHGLVRSLKTLKIMKAYTTKKGYKRINFCIKNKKKNFQVHRLVANAFIPNPLNKPQVNHLDGNKKNNHLSNLEWVTNQENKLHSYTNLDKSKISMLDAAFIRAVFKAKLLTQQELALVFDVRYTYINRIINFKRRKDK